jgi:site-specific DNA recombinase
MKYQAGILLPWTTPPYGYRLNPDRPRDPAGVWLDEAEAAVVRTIYDWYANEQSSLCGLAKHLQEQGVPTPSGKRIWSLCTLRAILRQPAYTGQVYACRYRYRPARTRRSATHPIGRPHDSLVERPPEEWIPVATIPALVSQEQFDMVQRKLAHNQSFAKRNNTRHQYLLRAMVSCGLCQASCTARRLQGGYMYYVCAGKAKAIHSRKEEKCPARFSPAAQLDELVWQDLCAVVTHPESMTQALERAHTGQWLPQELQARCEQIRQARGRLVQQIDRLTEAYLGSVIPLAEYQRRRHDLEQKGQALDNQERILTAQVDRHHQLAGLVASVEDFCQRVQAGLDHATFEQKRQLVELLIDRVVITNGDVEIRYVIPTNPSSEQVRFCHLRSDYFNPPNVIGTGGGDTGEQVRIDRLLVRALAQVGARGNRLHAHLAPMARHCFMVDAPPVPSELGGDASNPVAWPAGGDRINLVFKRDLLRRRWNGMIVPTRTIQAQ